jgi:hypothetical protein
MFARAARALQVILDVIEFLVRNLGKTPVGELSKPTDALKVVASNLSARANAQEAHKRESERATLRAQLKADELRRQFIAPIAKLVKVFLPQDPELVALLRMAEMKSYARVIVVAESLMDRVEPIKAKFVEAGFDEGFVDHVRAAVQELKAARAERAFHRGQQVRATAEISVEYARGRELVRLIDSMVTPHWKKEAPGKLAEWKTLSRFARAKKPKASTDGAAPVTPVTPVDTPETPVVEGGSTPPDSRMA